MFGWIEEFIAVGFSQRAKHKSTGALAKLADSLVIIWLAVFNHLNFIE
jgi:hypothetical protein